MAAPLRIYGPKSNSAASETWSPVGDMARGPRPPATPTRATATLQAESPYAERLIKLIPAEVVAIYLFGMSAIPAANLGATVAWAATCLVLVVIARAATTRDAPQRLPPQWAAIIISSVSFIIWIFTMPGPLQGFGVAPPFFGSLVMIVWTFLVPYIYKG